MRLILAILISLVTLGAIPAASAQDVLFSYGGINLALSPTCNPGSSTFSGPVVCTDPNPGTAIQCYTTNGSTPTTNGLGTLCGNGTSLASGGTITVSGNETINIVAGTSVLSDSPVATYVYTLPSTVFVSQAGGTASCGVDGTQTATAVGSLTWAAGNTYKLCGTITSALTVGGNGTSVNPITIFFETGAKFSLGVCASTGCLNIASRSWIIIDGGAACGWVGQAEAACNGAIQETASGTSFSNGSTASTAIDADGCTNCEIRNITLANIYVHNSSADSPSANFRGIQNLAVASGGGFFHVHNCIIHDVGSAIALTPATTAITGVEINNCSIHEMNSGTDLLNASNGTFTSGLIHDMHYGPTFVWDTTGCTLHHYATHSVATGSGATSGFSWYSNQVDGSWGACTTNTLALDSGHNGKWLVYNDLFVPTYTQMSSGLINMLGDGTAGGQSFLNNTVLGNNQSGDLCFNVGGAGNSITFENNIVENCHTLDQVQNSVATTTWDFNAYGELPAGGTVGFNGSSFGSLASWQTACGCEVHSVTANGGIANSLLVNPANGVVTVGSPAIGGGTNLTGLGIATLDIDIAGNNRPSTGAWDNGALMSFPVADFFVAPATATPPGNNSNTGTVLAPFLTLDHARQQVQTLKSTKAVTVMLRGGTYYKSSTNFTNADSGSQTFPIVYKNYPGENPVLSGGTQLTGWTCIGTACGAGSTAAICNGVTNCWQFSLSPSTPYFESLWYNGVRRFRPHMGSGLLGTWGHVAGGPTTADCGTDGNGDAWNCEFVYNSSDPVSAFPSCNLSTVHDCEYWTFAHWTVSIQRIKSITTGTHTILSTCTTNNCPNAGSGEYGTGWRYIIDNVKEQLKLAGQWFLDRTTSPNWTLTYLANPGENPNTDTVVVGFNNQVMNINGLSWTTFQGIQFQNDVFTVPATGYASAQLDPNMSPAMVECAACTDVVFNADIFTQTTGNALEFTGATTQSSMLNGLMYDIGGYGIRMGQLPRPGNPDSAVPNNNSVEQNAITGTGRFFPSSDAVMLGLSHHIDVGNNELSYTYHDGVEICLPSGGNCSGGTGSNGIHDMSIHDNEIHNIMQGMTSDGGGIYIMNSVSGCPSSATVAGTNDLLTHNRIHDVNDASTQETGGYGGWGLYFDQCSGLVDAENNLVYRTSATTVKMTNGPQSVNQGNIINNNILAYVRPAAGNGAVGILKPAPSALLQFRFSHNLVYEDQTSASIQFGVVQLFSPPNAPTVTQDYVSNMYFNTATNWSAAASLFHSSSTNYSLSGWQTFGEDIGSLIANPGFAHPLPCNANTNPQPGVCDDFSLGSTPGVGFVVFNQTYGRTISNPMAIPTVQDTFTTAVYNWKTDF